MRILALAILVAALGVGPSDLAAQHPDRYPDAGPVLLEVGTGRSDFLSALPASYLDGLTLRAYTADEALAGARSRSVGLGVRLGDRWILGAESVWIDSKLGAANLPMSATYRGGTLRYLLPGGFDVMGGGGAVTYRPRGGSANTDLRWTVGGGGWLRLSDGIALRTVVRDDMSWFSVPGTAGRLQHHLGGGASLVILIP